MVSMLSHSSFALDRDGREGSLQRLQRESPCRGETIHGATTARRESAYGAPLALPPADENEDSRRIATCLEMSDYMSLRTRWMRPEP